MVDPITDMLNRIRNAQDVLHPKVEIPFSILKYEIARTLERKGFIEKPVKSGKKEKKIIEIALKYEDKMPVIQGLKRISKPGQRIYFQAKKIRKVRGGYGIAVVSTSKGIMTGQEARRQKLGGEILCEIW